MSLGARFYNGSELRFARRWVVPNAARRIVRDSKRVAVRLARRDAARELAPALLEIEDAREQDERDAFEDAEFGPLSDWDWSIYGDWEECLSAIRSRWRGHTIDPRTWESASTWMDPDA